MAITVSASLSKLRSTCLHDSNEEQLFLQKFEDLSIFLEFEQNTFGIWAENARQSYEICFLRIQNKYLEKFLGKKYLNFFIT